MATSKENQLSVISPPRGAALCSVLASLALATALTTGVSSAAAAAGQHGHRSGKVHAARTHTASKCRPARHANKKHKACRTTRKALARTATTTIPVVSITSGPASGSTTSSTSATFYFNSGAVHSRFWCSRDAAPYALCSSPTRYSGLSNGSHTFSVYATHDSRAGQSVSVTWNVQTASADVTPPTPPSGLTASAGSSQVALSWLASTDNVGVSGYRVLRNGALVAQVTSISYTDATVTNGTSYSYAVVAFDAAGNVSAASAAVSATPLVPTLAPPPSSSPPPVSSPPAPIQAWSASTSVSFAPLSDLAAAADVIPTPENRSANTTANNTMPTSAQLASFYGTSDYWGRNVVAFNPYYRFVTGHYTGTTDQIIQWAAWKWGIPEDWLRAEYVQESMWKQAALGDLRTVTASTYALYPAQARVPGTLNVYMSMGLTQIKWSPDGRYGAGTEPMRWQSTAFNVDYQAATLRFYYDNPGGTRSSWGDLSYSPGNGWNSLGGWYASYPWLSSAQMSYISTVQGRLATRTWAQPGF